MASASVPGLVLACSSFDLLAGSLLFLMASVLVLVWLYPFVGPGGGSAAAIHLHRGRWWDQFMLAVFVLVAFVLLLSLTAQLSCRTS